VSIDREAIVDYLIRLRPIQQEGDNAPPARRLAGLLKVALRRFGLRCVEAREVKEDGDENPTNGR
jgi:hypothetical protein